MVQNLIFHYFLTESGRLEIPRHRSSSCKLCVGYLYTRVKNQFTRHTDRHRPRKLDFQIAFYLGFTEAIKPRPLLYISLPQLESRLQATGHYDREDVLVAEMEGQNGRLVNAQTYGSLITFLVRVISQNNCRRNVNVGR